MRYISDEIIRGWAKRAIPALHSSMGRYPVPYEIVHLVSVLVIRETMGDVWADKCLDRLHEKAGFRVPDSEPLRLKMYREMMFARMLLNVHNVSGFSDKIKTIQSKDFEGAFAEIQCSFSLKSIGVKHRFVKASGIKGRDYDMEVQLHWGGKVCLDVTTKQTESSISEKSLVNTLRRKGKQFPAGDAGIVVVFMNKKWLDNPDYHKIIFDASRYIFRNRRRIMSVYYTCMWVSYRKDLGRYCTMFDYLAFVNGESYFAKEYEGRIPYCYNLVDPRYEIRQTACRDLHSILGLTGDFDIRTIADTSNLFLTETARVDLPNMGFLGNL